MNATNQSTDTTWYDGSAPKGERRKPRPALLAVHLCATPTEAATMAFAQRSLGDRNVKTFARTIKAGGAVVGVQVVVSRAKGTRQ